LIKLWSHPIAHLASSAGLLSATARMKILCTGDIHIGRRPSRLPERIDCAALSCAKSWSSIVEKAVEERVDLVALSGDLVDKANRFYEAVGPLEQGIRELARRGIRTVAVAGNHDHDTLPWLADGLSPDFTLLGRGGRWERLTVERDGAPAVHVDGWSFPRAHHRDDPLRGYERREDDGLPVLGLLHADLEQPTSSYAPVRLADLRRQGVGFWLLGHVHNPGLREEAGAATVLYPGSPQAMDPGEGGLHGVWLVEIQEGRRFGARHLPLSRVRYEVVDVDVEGIEEPGALGRRISDAVMRRMRDIVENGCGPLRYLSCRIRLVGRTPLHRSLERHLAEVRDMELPYEGVMAVVEQVEIATRPARDLADLARGQDAPAVLARLIGALEEGSLGPEQERLLASAIRVTDDVRTAASYRDLSDRDVAGLPPEAIREILRDHALLLVDSLLAQKEAV
jgi:exonuclease SbcD